MHNLQLLYSNQNNYFLFDNILYKLKLYNHLKLSLKNNLFIFNDIIITY